MSPMVAHFFIATPDADDLDGVEKTLASVSAQSGDFTVTYLVNDAGGTTGVAQRLPTWQHGAEKVRRPGPPMSFVVTDYAGVGDFEVLDHQLSDVPNVDTAIIGFLPCGSRLERGALTILADVLERAPQLGLVRGFMSCFGQHGELTGLGFGLADDTWRSIGALADDKRDQRDLPGGLFCRAPVWHRLGRLDPALTYAGYLDLGSKAAMHTRLGQIEASLVTDRHRTLSPADAIRQEAEIVKVQRRAALRQKRLLARMSNGEIGTEGLSPPSRAVFDPDSRRWNLCEARQNLDLFGVVKIESGFLDVEGPYPGSGLPSRFRWTSASLTSFVVEAAEKPHRIHLRLRNPSPNQTVALYLNGHPIYRCRPKSASLNHAIDIDLVCPFINGRNTLALTADVMLMNDAGQSLGLIVEDVEIAAETA